MWYAVQTIAGKEEQFLEKARQRFDKTLCRDSFILRMERLKRLGGEWRIQSEPLFPGYAFVSTESPKELNQYLKLLDSGRVLGGGKDEFVPLEQEEVSFFLYLNRDNREPVVRLTSVKLSDDGEVLLMSGALEHYRQKIQKINLRKRYAAVSIPVAGIEKTVLFGLRLEKDLVGRERQNEC